jgi:hypothetical protein
VLFVCIASTAAFALPPCADCDDGVNCYLSPGSGTRCREIGGICIVTVGACLGLSDQDTLIDTMQIASVEVVAPAGVTRIATPAPRLVAQSAALRLNPASTH